MYFQYMYLILHHYCHLNISRFCVVTNILFVRNIVGSCMYGSRPYFVVEFSFKDTVALQMLYFLKIKIFISLDSCQFVEYLFKIKIYIFQFLKTKKGDNISFVYFYKIITFVLRCEKNLYSHSYSTFSNTSFSKLNTSRVSRKHVLYTAIVQIAVCRKKFF